MYFGYDFRYDDNEPMDPVGHGTHVAGTIGAVGNNNSGVTGVMQKVKLMALKAGGEDGVLTDHRHSLRQSTMRSVMVLK